MAQKFTYTAFISYNHQDADLARTLHYYLEHYTFPRAYRRKFPHLSLNLRPVFIDHEELAIDDLNEALQEALATSRYLIIICSENSLKPNEEGKNWVETEVRIFLSLNPQNARRLIPVILREEGGLSAPECMLPDIRARNIRGADVFVLGQERAFSDVVAKMVGLKPGILWDRHQRELRRRRRRRRIMAGIAAALAAVAGWCGWYYYTPHVSCYTDYIERGNIPEGLFELTGEQVQTRQRHYRFTEHKLRLRKVEYCNSIGTLQEHRELWNINRPASMEFEYREDGTAARCVHRNAQGKELCVRKFNPGCIDFVQTKGDNNMEVSQSISMSTNQVPSGIMFRKKADIGRYAVHRNPSGLITQELYRRALSDTPAKDAQGLSGRAYELDSLGRPEEVRNLIETAHGEVEITENQRGIASYKLRYGADGQVSSITHTDKEGKHTRNEELWAEMRLSYDARGNLQEKSFHGPDGKLCMTRDGFARITSHYDEKGNKVEQTYLGMNGKPCLNRNGFARVTCLYDEKGNILEQSLFGVDGTPCLHRDGFARVAWRLDEKGNILEQAFFGTDGQPRPCREGNARVTWRYDEKGNKLEEVYFGTDGQLCLHRDGYARITWRYDGKGNTVEQTFFGADGQPCLSADGFARITWRYDERGNNIEQAYFGADGHPCLPTEGIARLSMRYDERGNILEQAFFDTDGQPCLSQYGFARSTSLHDDKGNLREQAFFDTDGQPCRCQNGFARITWKYDARGNNIEEAYFDTKGRPCLSKEGYARIIMRYDDRSNIVEEAYYGVTGKPCTPRNGASRLRYAYDEAGKLTEIIAYDRDGNELGREKVR